MSRDDPQNKSPDEQPPPTTPLKSGREANGDIVNAGDSLPSGNRIEFDDIEALAENQDDPSNPPEGWDNDEPPAAVL